ncbi:MaoC family dehydratase N-terminal domain-containing protein [Saccharopolyspora sp. K220]|uniref:MaoC family dehydratase N-terminal domain-containing protein n=1 Tax=Saccharopolyspora soli TaxID=2926618 RepID=UPI001F57663A|nr:MaoC family dehydratase N-terminal domain-containing protein [Saccharopolyspora soli]MCI2418241.1 MaoC family dehydratase N-terminal domain-containing protein [Saccharopolyspora soli]
MAIDPALIGTALPPIIVDVEAGRLRFFASAIGETDPVYTDLGAARAAGHPNLPVPPTFLFGLTLDGPDSFGFLGDLGVDLREVLHGEQEFTYHSVAHAGETLVLRPVITDVYTKKGGALEFVVRNTAVTRADGSAVADLTETLIVRHWSTSD